MAYDLEEQEQIDTLKAWWKQNGNMVTWLVIAALSTYVGWSAWTNYQGKQSSQASTLYEEVQRAATAKENAKVQVATAALVEKYGRTTYASMAALAAAKSAIDANDLKAAKTQLTWLQANAATAEFKAIANLRLASIALDEKAYDDGLKYLNGDFPADFAADVADRKADIFVAQNKIAEARASYQVALAKATDKNPGRQLIEIKLDAIGGAPEVKATVPAEKK
ncbi:MAG: tetratricopeptide repeat protein [Telluria sp.]|nr:tetratricopeptide repeat protein [Telluria sp.]